MKKFVTSDIPPEWRAAVEAIVEPERPLPSDIPQYNEKAKKLSDLLAEDAGIVNSPIALDKTDKIIQSAEIIQKKIQDCRRTLEEAETMRSKIAASAELIHGECDSHLAAEQRLNVFVKSIDSLLKYYDDLERINLDLKSPNFTVLSPDFPENLRKIEDGIRFFEMNSHFKDSKGYLIKYQALQIRVMEIIRDYISQSIGKVIQRIRFNKKIDEQYKNDIYIRFRPGAAGIMRLFQMCEKLVSFSEVLSVYKLARIELLNPILASPINDIVEIRPRAATTITYAFKEYDLSQSYFRFDSHPLYSKCFSDLIAGIGQLFYDSCCGSVLKSTDIKQLCDICIVLKGDVLQEEISRIPIAAERFRSYFLNLLSEAQERLMFRTELYVKEIVSNAETASQKTIEILSLLYYALPSESFGETACNLLNECINSLVESSKKYKASQIEADSYKLCHFLVLRDQIALFDSQLIGTSQTLDFEPVTEFLWRLIRFDSSVYQLKGDRGLIQSVVGLSRVINTSIDGRKQLESSTSLAFKSLTATATQILVQPLINLKARQGKEKSQILSAIEGVKTIISDHYKTDIGDKVKAHISNPAHLTAVLEVLKVQLLEVIEECYASFGDVDQETKENMNHLITIIKELQF